MSKQTTASLIEPGSGTSPTNVNAASSGGGSTAAGKQRVSAGDPEVLLKEASSMLDKIQHTAQNVTCCQNQIDQVFSRAGELLQALRADGKLLEPSKLQAAAALVDETFKNIQKHMLRFAIYGRPKAFVCREEMTAYFEALNVEMDSVLKSFSVTEHHDVQDWEGEYYQAKLEDEVAHNEQLWQILNHESDLKIIMEMGRDGVDSLSKAIKEALDYPHTPKARAGSLRNALKNFEVHKITDLVMMQPRELFKAPDPIRVSSLRPGPSGASSSSTSLNKPRSSIEIPGESAAARAKREEAEREREEALRRGEEMYEDPPLPRWEPRRPPPGRGPGSIDGTSELAQRLENVHVVVEVDAGGVSQEGGAASVERPPPDMDDLPPSYS